MSGADIGLPGKMPILNCCFRIFSASSMSLIVIVAVSNRLKLSIGRPTVLCGDDLFHDIGQVVAGPYPNPVRYRSH